MCTSNVASFIRTLFPLPLRTVTLKDSEVRLRLQWRLQLRMKKSVGVESGEVEKVWKEFKV